MESIVLKGERVTLRTLGLIDAEAIFRFAGDPRVPALMTGFPHPYPGITGAQTFIERSWLKWQERAGADLAITLTRPDDPLIIGNSATEGYPETADDLLGIIGMFAIDDEYRSAEMGYWLGVPFWGKGLASEAARLMIRLGFERLGLNRITAVCWDANVGSARVMEKAGMRFEGLARDEVWKDGRFIDRRHYAILKREWAGA